MSRISCGGVLTTVPVIFVTITSHTQEHPMYDMYPEWGPSKNRTDEPQHQQALQALQAALDLRDNGGQFPDDN
ncbi:MAG: hypothetical protein WKF79_11060 [Nocardioides sp.]